MPSTTIQFFDYFHLKGEARRVSSLVYDLAHTLEASIPDSAEKSAGMRKLLEAKDCFVRAVLPASNIETYSDGQGSTVRLTPVGHPINPDDLFRKVFPELPHEFTVVITLNTEIIHEGITFQLLNREVEFPDYSIRFRAAAVDSQVYLFENPDGSNFTAVAYAEKPTPDKAREDAP